VKKAIKKLLNTIPEIDIVWCFETNIYQDLSIFGKCKKVFHVVDPINIKNTKISKTADLTVCISNRILNQFKNICEKKVFINHGISAVAINQGKEIDFENYQLGAVINAGYIGNLSREIIDIKTIRKIVAENPSIIFHFWGPGNESNLGGETDALLQSLIQFENVIFHSVIPSSELINTIKNMDLFLLAYNNIKGVYDGSNSHKILEYLVTGKVVVSTYIDQYNDYEFKDYLVMSHEGNNDLLPSKFREVVNNISFYNSSKKMRNRREFALSNSYVLNAKKILALLN
jgi:glycosyltransferase involved in cell wall biosynthesis